MTENSYHNKMSDYAYKNNMDQQLIKAGKNTRFKSDGNSGRYKRSYQTNERLIKAFKEIWRNRNDK